MLESLPWIRWLPARCLRSRTYNNACRNVLLSVSTGDALQAEHAISDEVLFRGVEKSLRKYFGKRGEQVVQDNLKAVSRGFRESIEIPREAMTLPDSAKTN
jgi:hypothetical protein